MEALDAVRFLRCRVGYDALQCIFDPFDAAEEDLGAFECKPGRLASFLLDFLQKADRRYFPST